MFVVSNSIISTSGWLYDDVTCTVHTNWPVEYQGNGEQLASMCADTKAEDGSMQWVYWQHQHPASNDYNHLLVVVSSIVFDANLIFQNTITV